LKALKYVEGAQGREFERLEHVIKKRRRSKTLTRSGFEGAQGGQLSLPWPPSTQNTVVFTPRLFTIFGDRFCVLPLYRTQTAIPATTIAPSASAQARDHDLDQISASQKRDSIASMIKLIFLRALVAGALVAITALAMVADSSAQNQQADAKRYQDHRAAAKALMQTPKDRLRLQYHRYLGLQGCALDEKQKSNAQRAFERTQEWILTQDPKIDVAVLRKEAEAKIPSLDDTFESQCIQKYNALTWEAPTFIPSDFPADVAARQAESPQARAENEEEQAPSKGGGEEQWVRPDARLSVIVSNDTPFGTDVMLYSQNRPGKQWGPYKFDGQRAVPSARPMKTVINCKEGEKICIGAVDPLNKFTWGIGAGDGSCKECCFHCDGRLHSWAMIFIQGKPMDGSPW
jgi:hypothetical protein